MLMTLDCQEQILLSNNMTDTSMQQEAQQLDEWAVKNKMLLDGQKSEELCQRSTTTSSSDGGRNWEPVVQ